MKTKATAYILTAVVVFICSAFSCFVTWGAWIHNPQNEFHGPDGIDFVALASMSLGFFLVALLFVGLPVLLVFVMVKFINDDVPGRPGSSG